MQAAATLTSVPVQGKHEPRMLASKQVPGTAPGAAFCERIVPTQVTFISSAANMAPIATRKAALVRFREKKARSHFAPKVWTT
jgi:hypothetical protein